MKRVVYFAVPLLLFCGCKDETIRSAATSEPVYSRQYRQASATVIVSLSETNIPTSGKIRLMIDVHAPVDAEVAIPEIGTFTEPFTVVEGYAEPVQLLPNGKQLHRRVWTLVPGLPGATDFQALEIGAGPESVETEPIAVSVSSLLPRDVESREIKDLAAPAALLPEQKKRQRVNYILFAVAASMAIAAGLVSLLRRPKKAIIVPPDTAALQALENLPDGAAFRVDATRRILLEYLERQFHIPTAGKTTGEIIRTIPGYPLLGRRIVLANFLTASDLVRFSNRIPEGYAEGAVEYVRGFVKETTEALCD